MKSNINTENIKNIFWVMEKYGDNDYKRLSIDLPSYEEALKWKSKWSKELKEEMIIVQIH